MVGARAAVTGDCAPPLAVSRARDSVSTACDGASLATLAPTAAPPPLEVASSNPDDEALRTISASLCATTGAAATAAAVAGAFSESPASATVVTPAEAERALLTAPGKPSGAGIRCTSALSPSSSPRRAGGCGSCETSRGDWCAASGRVAANAAAPASTTTAAGSTTLLAVPSSMAWAAGLPLEARGCEAVGGGCTLPSPAPRASAGATTGAGARATVMMVAGPPSLLTAPAAATATAMLCVLALPAEALPPAVVAIVPPPLHRPASPLPSLMATGGPSAAAAGPTAR